MSSSSKALGHNDWRERQFDAFEPGSSGGSFVSCWCFCCVASHVDLFQHPGKLIDEDRGIEDMFAEVKAKLWQTKKSSIAKKTNKSNGKRHRNQAFQVCVCSILLFIRKKNKSYLPQPQKKSQLQPNQKLSQHLPNKNSMSSFVCENVWNIGMSGNCGGNASDEEMVTNLDAILHLAPGGRGTVAVDCNGGWQLRGNMCIL